jgi:cytochrome o ubiquinol oxidase subunit IV
LENFLEAIKKGKGNFRHYQKGFVLSIILTLIAFFIVAGTSLSGWFLDLTIVFIGFVQVIIQLIFFLHLGEEPRPQLNLHFFFFMALVVIIVVLGSLWIIYNLNYRVM